MPPKLVTMMLTLRTGVLLTLTLTLRTGVLVTLTLTLRTGVLVTLTLTRRTCVLGGTGHVHPRGAVVSPVTGPACVHIPVAGTVPALHARETVGFCAPRRHVEEGSRGTVRPVSTSRQTELTLRAHIACTK
jgi:hypothetical protein